MMVNRPPTFFFLRFDFALARRRRPPSNRNTEQRNTEWRETIIRVVHVIIRAVQVGFAYVIIRAVEIVVRVLHSINAQTTIYNGKPSADIVSFRFSVLRLRSSGSRRTTAKPKSEGKKWRDTMRRAVHVLEKCSDFIFFHKT